MANTESMRTLYRRENNYEEVIETERDLTNKIEDYLADGLTYAKISKKLGVSERKISNLVKKQKEKELEQKLKAQRPSYGPISKEKFLFVTMNLKNKK